MALLAKSGANVVTAASVFFSSLFLMSMRSGPGAVAISFARRRQSVFIRQVDFNRSEAQRQRFQGGELLSAPKGPVAGSCRAREGLRSAQSRERREGVWCRQELRREFPIVLIGQYDRRSDAIGVRQTQRPAVGLIRGVGPVALVLDLEDLPGE